jgi:pimeloyl-ACP methyl ester carboxylesterase
VPLDRDATVPGTIRIRAARLASKRGTRPPLIGLTGGPGQAGVTFLEDYNFILPTVGRDLVVLDQRGTGGSGLLRCPTLEGRIERGVERSTAACGERLGARRSFYTSADSAEDLEALRIRLGAPRIALYAVSYGTRVAVEYARRHPDRVERMILDSPIGIDAPDPFARETIAAIGPVVRRVCRIGCGRADAHPIGDLRRLVARLRRSPIRQRVRRDGRRVTVKVTAEDVLGLLVSSDLFSELMRRIPPAVRSALGGNPKPLVGLKLSLGGAEDGESPSEFSAAVYAATTCEESPFAWDPAADPATRKLQARAALGALPASQFAPFDPRSGRRFGPLSLCGSWPARVRPAVTPPPLPTSVPTLVLSGELDLRTPNAEARRLATALHGKLVTERGVGHSVLGTDFNGCATPAVEDFLAGRKVGRCARGGASIGVARSALRRQDRYSLRP